MSPDPSDLEQRLALMRENMKMMTKAVPWARDLGFEVTRIEKGRVWGSQPWDDSLVGDPDTGVIHGGVITTLLDNLCGMSCSAILPDFRFVATSITCARPTRAAPLLARPNATMSLARSASRAPGPIMRPATR